MSTFDTIIHSTNQLSHAWYRDEEGTAPGLHTLFYSSLLTHLTHQTKFQWLEDVMHNVYFCELPRERIALIAYFCRVQKVYHTLQSVCIMWKRRKAKCVVNTDLQLNPIVLGDSGVVNLFHEHNHYLFSLSDLLKLTFSALTHADQFFSTPLPIKNPYNNVPFGKSVLYYIGECLNTHRGRHLNHDHVDVFAKFMKVHFDLTAFLSHNEPMLRDHAIQNYLTNATRLQLKRDIYLMLDDYNGFQRFCGIFPDKDFPDSELIRIFKPYIKLYLTTHYSLVPKAKWDASSLLERKLSAFRDFNPRFGHKMAMVKERTMCGKLAKCKTGMGFNTKHVKFEPYVGRDPFLSSHLTVRPDPHLYTHTPPTQFMQSLALGEMDEDEDDYVTDEEDGSH